MSCQSVIPSTCGVCGQPAWNDYSEATPIDADQLNAVGSGSHWGMPGWPPAPVAPPTKSGSDQGQLAVTSSGRRPYREPARPFPHAEIEAAAMAWAEDLGW
jgi:hypothetical protein